MEKAAQRTWLSPGMLDREDGTAYLNPAVRVKVGPRSQFIVAEQATDSIEKKPLLTGADFQVAFTARRSPAGIQSAKS